LIFTALGCAISFVLLASFSIAMNSPQHRYDDSLSIFNPVFWVPSLFVGLIINRFVLHRWAFFAPGIVGILIMTTIVIWDVSLFRRSAREIVLAHGNVWRYELGRLFSPMSSLSTTEEDRGLVQLFFTFPFLSSVAYTLGAWLAITFGDRERLCATNTTK
jgi:hypothetical protein